MNADFSLNFLEEKYKWAFNILADYSKLKVTPFNVTTGTHDEKIETVASDNLIYETVFDLKMPKEKVNLDDFYLFAKLAYDTEIEKDKGQKLEKIVRYTFGTNFNNYKIFNTISIGKFFERNITASNTRTDGWSIILTNKKRLINNDLTTKLDLKYHVDGDDDNMHMFKRELRLESNISIPINENLYVAPFINLFNYQMKTIKKGGNAILVGVKFSFSKLFDLN
jgi:hypothetical protein